MKYSDGGLANVPMSIARVMQGQAPTTSLKNKITGASQVSRLVSVTQGPIDPPIPLSSPPLYSRVYSGLSEMVYINANSFRFFLLKKLLAIMLVYWIVLLCSCAVQDGIASSMYTITLLSHFSINVG